MLKAKKKLEHNLKLKIKNGYINKPELKEYLKSLLELEFSVIKKYISDEERSLIENMKIYQEIAIYNIYHRAIQLAEKLNLDINTQATQLFLSKDNYYLYSFDFNFPEEKIGIINIRHTLEDKSELNRLRTQLYLINKIEDAKTLYPWSLEQPGVLSFLSNKIQELKHNKKLTIEEKQEVEIINKVYEAFMNDYGLTENDFAKVRLNCNELSQQDNFLRTETLVKQEPNLRLTIHKKYL